MRKLVLLVSVIAGSLLVAPVAHAAIPSALGITCTVATDDVRECGNSAPRSTAASWDGTPIDVNIAFPPASGTDGDYPLIIVGHGYGGSKIGFGAPDSTDGLRHFTSQGYAVFSMTDRGFHESCGSDASITAGGAACDNGYIHLMDDRYEVRDAQFLVGELADEGLADGQRIGATGGSYGGGLSLQLGTLKDRVMMPDGSLVAWTSPVDHIPMRIAGAAPNIPWSDLAYSLTPNGRQARLRGRPGLHREDGHREGVVQQRALPVVVTLGAGKYCGQAPYPSPCTDFGADVTAWKTRIEQGEPYDGDPNAQAVLNEIQAHHSGYYIDHSEPPAPLMISNGFDDDLFPADEAIGYYNRIRSQYPDAPISMFFGDFGHQRSLNKDADSQALDAAQIAWLNFYVKGAGSQPFQGVTAYTLTCPPAGDPTPPRDFPSGGPFQAGSWAGLEHGVVRLRDGATKTISATGGSASVDTTFDPVRNGVSGGTACDTAPADDLPGVATYRAPAAQGSGYTLLGSATVVATIASPEANNELAARLLDVAPDGTETLVARQLYRPDVGTSRQVFQLHPSGHLFAAGHVAKLELLPKDAGGGSLNSYGRPANGQGDITVSNLDLRLPVAEGPGAAGGQVTALPALMLPCGQEIAPQFSSSEFVRATLGNGKAKRKGRSLTVPVDSAPNGSACKVQVKLVGKKPKKKGKGSAAAAKKKKKGKKRILGKASATIDAGKSGTVKVKLSKSNAQALGKKVRVELTTLDPTGNTVQNAQVKVSGKKAKKHKKK